MILLFIKNLTYIIQLDKNYRIEEFEHYFLILKNYICKNIDYHNNK